jgi:hypothetical protein
LVFRWVKFEGKTQSWVAEQLEINQSTVSRMVEKYERWIARGGPTRQGGLSYDERLRAARWLAIERNEWILNSALRMAAELEKPVDATRSTVSRSAASPSQETEIRTQHVTVDRSGAVARYLRLAHRVNMENLKLVGEEPLTELEPLTVEDVGEDRLPAVLEESRAGCARHDVDRMREELDAHTASTASPARDSADLAGPTPMPAGEPMHDRHNATAEELNLTSVMPDGSGEITGVEKAAEDAYAVVIYPPGTAAPTEAASELFCLAPRMESVALAIVRRVPGGFMPDEALGGSVWFGN